MSVQIGKPLFPSLVSLFPNFLLLFIPFIFSLSYFISFHFHSKAQKRGKKKRKKDFFFDFSLDFCCWSPHHDVGLLHDIFIQEALANDPFHRDNKNHCARFSIFFFFFLFFLFSKLSFSHFSGLNCNEELIKLLEDIVHYLSFFDLHCIWFVWYFFSGESLVRNSPQRKTARQDNLLFRVLIDNFVECTHPHEVGSSGCYYWYFKFATITNNENQITFISVGNNVSFSCFHPLVNWAKVKREVKGKEKEKDKSRTEEQESSPKDFTPETSPAESGSYQTLSASLQADLQIFA